MFANNYAACYDELTKHRDYKQRIEWIYDWAERPKSILDVGCGTALYWKYWPDGTRLIGIEKSRSMIHESVYQRSIFMTDVMREDFFHPIDRIEQFDLGTALFDVVNYTQHLYWVSQLPIKKGGFFIFDVWDKEKIRKEGFKTTKFESHTEYAPNKVKRLITPLDKTDNFVILKIDFVRGSERNSEIHKMYLHSKEEIFNQTKNCFDIIDFKLTDTWAKWYKLRRK